ncbi:proton-conducting transporter membrane subunit [Cypionkella sp.]|uniref:proton-conducting transporter transmembrane domain-containing protein n=1 Tax=Cypionkella sp. TaxID=2811411 RepID=UPI002727C50D|nr:proton-conducting transporter membrane subunit [Cypionkella sp.]MDO8983097.1 proton-conducting transporter membrane subunit [Cypionkella sp.]MDP2050742.1 proton-conducting transporter membrane subunit [Cypionkella sp.]
MTNNEFYAARLHDYHRQTKRVGKDTPVTPALLPYLAPVVLLLCAALGAWRSGRRPAGQALAAEAAGMIGIATAFGSVALLILSGPSTANPLPGLSIRLDVISAVMLCLVSFIGWVVLRYAATYVDGEARQGAFMGWMCATLAAVMLLVTAGHLVQLVLAWIATSLSLHQLLLFYPDRPQARRAAHKKLVTSGLSNLVIIAAALVLWRGFGSGDIATILDAARSGIAPTAAAWAAGLIALAAVLKSAQFPTHGWLTEVMETPTPVSALLHAGVINAGGFLMIRFADVMLTAPGVLAVLVMLGGFTAIFGGMVMLTQSAVKTSLAWSTVAQMGFMVLQCGLALFPLALLHIVAHSLYKAHAFLASGGAVDAVALIQRPGPIAVPSGAKVGQAFLAAMAIYVLMTLGFGFSTGLDHKSPQAIALGAILIFGVAYLIAQGLAGAAPRALTLATVIYALAASLGYFALQAAAEALTTGTLPVTPAPGPLEWTLIVLAVLSFGLVAVAQALFPLWAHHPAAAGLRVHLTNGLYANAVFDRLLGGWSKSRDV